MKRSYRTRKKILPRLKPESYVFSIDVEDVMADLDPGLATTTPRS